MLSSNPVDPVILEQSVNTLIYEWLGTWFDGQSHSIGRRSALFFPEAQVKFQETDIQQLHETPVIHWMWLRPTSHQASWEPTPVGPDRVMDQRQTWMVYVKATGSDLSEAEHRAREVSDRLYWIANHSGARADLSAKGVRITSADQPALVAGSGPARGVFSLRRVNVHGRIRAAMGELVE